MATGIRCEDPTHVRKRSPSRRGEWCYTCSRANNNRRRSELKAAAYERYGPACQCCGESEVLFLAIDHIEGGGGQHRGKIGSHIYHWLAANGYPDGFRVLCHNCNWAMHANGACPHQERK